MFKLVDIWFKYQFDEKWVFRSLNLDIWKGTWSIAGPNGSGKSTLLKILLYVLKPIKGEIYLWGKRVKSPKETRKHIVYVPTNVKSFLIGPRVKDELERAKESEILEVFEEYDYKIDVKKPIYHLSEGQMRILAVTVAMFSGKEIIVLDEPTIGLDKKYRTLLLDLINELKSRKNFLIASNDIRLLSRIPNMIYLNGERGVQVGETRKLFYTLTDLSENSSIVKFSKELGLDSQKPINSDELNEAIRREKKCLASS